MNFAKKFTDFARFCKFICDLKKCEFSKEIHKKIHAFLNFL